MVEEIKALQTEAENAGEDVSKAAEVAGKMAELLKKYEGDMASMEEFGNIMEENETAQKIMEDKAFEEEMKKEFGDLFEDI